MHTINPNFYTYIYIGIYKICFWNKISKMEKELNIIRNQNE
jgi:hypothetical protein